MITVKNRKDLEAVYQSEMIDRLFVSSEAEGVLKESLEKNVDVLVEAYGENGDGGGICIITDSLSTREGQDEYFELLQRYHLEPDMWEFNDILVQTEKEKVCLQLFVMTEYNVLVLYRIQKGSVQNEVFL